MSTTAPNERSPGHAALERGSWAKAREHFEQELSVRESPEALEGLSWAAWWLEEIDACVDARERAYHAYRLVDNARGVARMALWLGDDHASFLGAHAVAEGWFALATRALDDCGPCPERGWLTVFEAHSALARREVDVVLQMAGDARECGRRFGAIDLEMFGLATEGVALIAGGEVRSGLRALDEAATAATAGSFENLAPAAWTCCLVMAACEELRDFDRAAQWCRRIDRFSRDMDARFVRGVCRAHYAAIHTWRADWEVAEAALAEALVDLTTRRPYYRSEGIVRLGHLRLRQHRWTEAEALFEQAGQHPLALQGLAALLTERGEHDSARELLDRMLQQSPAETSVIRAGALELLVQLDIAAGNLGMASDHVEQLRVIAGSAETDGLYGALAAAEAKIAHACGDLAKARSAWEDAIDSFSRCAMPLEAATARLELASVLVGLQRPGPAAQQARTALNTFLAAGVARESEQARLLLAGLERDTHQPRPAGSLTYRQQEVLRLVAEGLSDHEIADRLYLSPHTVHRHIANIFSRLDCSSRAAAVAEAGRLGLL